jgi:hypothetical protein
VLISKNHFEDMDMDTYADTDADTDTRTYTDSETHSGTDTGTVTDTDTDTDMDIDIDMDMDIGSFNGHLTKSMCTETLSYKIPENCILNVIAIFKFSDKCSSIKTKVNK